MNKNGFPKAEFTQCRKPIGVWVFRAKVRLLKRLKGSVTICERRAEAAKLDTAIAKNLKGLGYGRE